MALFLKGGHLTTFLGDTATVEERVKRRRMSRCQDYQESLDNPDLISIRDEQIYGKIQATNQRFD